MWLISTLGLFKSAFDPRVEPRHDDAAVGGLIAAPDLHALHVVRIVRHENNFTKLPLSYAISQLSLAKNFCGFTVASHFYR